jgi:hypothetical protein
VHENEKQLCAIVGAQNVLNGPEILDTHARDHSFALSIRPRFVVRPSNASEVQTVVKWANQTRTPLVPVSSGPPHFHGDTVPSEPGAIIVDLARMKRILKIDRRNKMVVIEPGVTYSQLAPELANEGLRVTMPLLPRANKSVTASLLERQPITIPRYQYSLTEPLRNCGVVWGNGEITYTGEAGNASYSLEEQWKAGGRQVDPKGPAQTDFMRIISGAQGSMGIVVWASIKCELLPSARKFFFVPAERLDDLIDFSCWLQRLRLGDEVILTNDSALANMLGKDQDSINAIRQDLPSWVMIIVVAGRALFPEERVRVQAKDIEELAQRFGLKLLTGLFGTTHKDIQDTILNPSKEPYWKLNYRGGCEDVFFLTTLDRIPQYIKTVFSAAETFKYPIHDIGIYVQPQHQGTAYHCEFNLPFDPQDSKEVVRLRRLHSNASEELIRQGAYFSRPYGAWAKFVYNRDAQSTIALRKVKQIFDPCNVMNPGKLCF